MEGGVAEDFCLTSIIIDYGGKAMATTYISQLIKIAITSSTHHTIKVSNLQSPHYFSEVLVISFGEEGQGLKILLVEESLAKGIDLVHGFPPLWLLILAEFAMDRLGDCKQLLVVSWEVFEGRDGVLPEFAEFFLLVVDVLVVKVQLLDPLWLQVVVDLVAEEGLEPAAVEVAQVDQQVSNEL